MSGYEKFNWNDWTSFGDSWRFILSMLGLFVAPIIFIIVGLFSQNMNFMKTVGFLMFSVCVVFFITRSMSRVYPESAGGSERWLTGKKWWEDQWNKFSENCSCQTSDGVTSDDGEAASAAPEAASTE